MKKHMLLEAEIWTVARTDKGNAVLVRPLNSEQVVPIFIGQLEAQSILIGLGKVPMPRPLTHDLFDTLLAKLSAELLRVEIVDLKEGTFYANLVVQQGEHSFPIDARPSDAIALAVRNGTQVFIAEEIVEETGVSTALIVEENPHMQHAAIDETLDAGDEPFMEEFDTEEPPAHSHLKELQLQLDRAVSEENYEEAARLRDQINALL